MLTVVKFQPTPPRGRRRVVTVQSLEQLLFQPTPPRGRRRHQLLRLILRRVVSTHASAREATLIQ